VRLVVARAGAELVAATVPEGTVLGMAWGKTLSALVASLPRLSEMSVVQLTGAPGADLSQSPVELVRLMAQNSGGAAYPIFAPLVVGSAATAAALRAQPDIARAMSMHDDVTTALVSIGSWNPPDSQLYWATPDAERQDLVARGVVAEVSSTLVAADGTPVADDFADRAIAISAEKLRAIPRVLAVASGVPKAGAVAAVARAGLITGLVTDAGLAEEVLAGGRA
jgi:DNA-binding transcriptional regulator LsrR (DeoR family)